MKELESFIEKYEFVRTAIREEDLPKERTMYNHLHDELTKHAMLADWTRKSPEDHSVAPLQG